MRAQIEAVLPFWLDRPDLEAVEVADAASAASTSPRAKAVVSIKFGEAYTVSAECTCVAPGSSAATVCCAVFALGVGSGVAGANTLTSGDGNTTLTTQGTVTSGPYSSGQQISLNVAANSSTPRWWSSPRTAFTPPR